MLLEWLHLMMPASFLLLVMLSIFEVKDREKALVVGSLRREKDAFGWAEEVLITKTDLEEMRVHMQELEEKVFC